MLTRRNFLKSGLITVGLLTAGEAGTARASGQESPLFPQHGPLGTGQGIHPGRVVWTHDPEAVHWSGMDFWWKPENFDADRVLAMTRKGIMRLTGEGTPNRPGGPSLPGATPKTARREATGPARKSPLR